MKSNEQKMIEAAHRELNNHNVIGTENGQALPLDERIRRAFAPPEKLYTSHEVGALLQMDPSSIVKWVNDGMLPAYRTPGGHRRVRASDLLTFLKQHGMWIPAELTNKAA